MFNSWRQRRVSRSIITSAVHRSIEGLEPRTLLSAGLLDTTFNLTGKQTADYGGSTQDGISVAFQNDHKAIVVGDVQNTGGKDAFVSRWNEDGSPDTNYGTSGVTMLDLGHDEIATDVAIDSSGRAVVCGITGTLSGSSPSGSFFVARYNTNGTLDTTFNAGGTGDGGSKPGVRVISLASLSGASGIMIDSTSGRITVVGAAVGNSLGGGIGIVFLKPDGTFDTSVGAGTGKVVTNPGVGIVEGATDVVAGPSGHFFVSGFSINAGSSLLSGTLTSQFEVAEFNSDGTLTTSFGTGGRATATFSDSTFTGNISLALGVAYDATTGKVAAAGAYADGLIDLVPPGVQTGATSGAGHAQHADFAVAQFNATTGALDPTFFSGHGEAVSVSDNGAVGLAGASDVLYQPDGKIAAGGGVEDPTDSDNADFATIRFNTNGSFDTTFGPNQNGIAITDFDHHSDGAFGMRLQTWNNQIYEVGHTKASGTSGLVALVRYTSDTTVLAPTLSIGNTSVTEGNNGTTAATFTVTLSGSPTGTVTVNYSTAPGSADLSDYALTTGTLTFAPGETSKTIPVNVFGDTLVEPDENFFVVLSSPTSGVTLSNATGTATILNDDVSTTNNNKLQITALALGKFSNPLLGGAKNATGTATVTLKNTGAKALSGTITVNVYASVDQAFSKSQDKVVGTFSVKLAKPLAKNGTVAAKVNVTIPKYATNTNVYLIATATGPGVTDVAGGAVASKTTLSVQEPTVTLIGVTGMGPVVHAKSNAKATVVVPLKNTGNSPAVGTVNFDVFLTTDGTLATEQYFFFDNANAKSGTVGASINIAAGKPGKATFSIKLPPATGNGLNHLTPGSYILLVRIHTSKLSTANTTNGSNVGLIPIVVS